MASQLNTLDVRVGCRCGIKVFTADNYVESSHVRSGIAPIGLLKEGGIDSECTGKSGRRRNAELIANRRYEVNLILDWCGLCQIRRTQCRHYSRE
jgi:hypothetical protein